MTLSTVFDTKTANFVFSVDDVPLATIPQVFLKARGYERGKDQTLAALQTAFESAIGGKNENDLKKISGTVEAALLQTRALEQLGLYSSPTATAA